MVGTKRSHKAQIRMPDNAAIADAADWLVRGGIVAVPTETVYGLAANAGNAHAVASVYAAKGRPDFNPLIVHVPNREKAGEFAIFDARADALARAFWPGPLTIVLPLRTGAKIAAAVTAGLPTIALRCPQHPVMRALLEGSGMPLAAPSANRSGAISPTRAAHVAASLGDAVPIILDGGPCAAGLESTIVALRGDDERGGGWQVLRPGPVSGRQIADVLGSPESEASVGSVEAPGQMASHYAPGKPLRLDAAEAKPGEFHIGFGGVAGRLNLSPTGDLFEAAARLYEALHIADASADEAIAVASIPAEGIGAAIADRLRRAAVR